ncbi:hypothetical protein [Clostridium botulinum]|uniref:hypothetical protein n=1 Tax=Clostridium botulinum TaxID=1491 RepID=UPI0002EC2CC8|nr:hypothetical protein [Clostridium botulinum]KEI92597.1 hypothetical protein N491_12345 [Clostridium botulinum B2 275]NFB16185.1 hypothetical protein [Clostridium botulinum]NFB68397.1 hypothetical protein [Clostridium botulinum]NFB96660.1 hypothetical protein [Clostridium botulinum]NFC57359.1 hypothetical protein [Clostridium botulinum]
MNLETRLKKCCCKNISVTYKQNEWYKVELFYNNRYYRFFDVSLKEVERKSLNYMRKLNRRLKVKMMARGEVTWFQKHRAML